MITENLSILKIHKLSQTQYERELAAGNIDPNALYLTQDEGSEAISDIPNVVRYDAQQELTLEQQAQARFNIDAVEISDIYANNYEKLHYTWDGVTDGRDVINIAEMYFYKISDEVPSRKLMQGRSGILTTFNDNSTTYTNVNTGDSDSSYDNIGFYNGHYIFSPAFIAVDLSVIFVEQPGSYCWGDDINSPQFDAPSAGVYFPYRPDGSFTGTTQYVSSIELIVSPKSKIILNSDDSEKCFTVQVDTDGTLKTVSNDGDTTVKMATESSVASQISNAIGGLTKITALTQEEYNELVADGAVQEDVAYMIVSGSA